jgi:hypothetical protein
MEESELKTYRAALKNAQAAHARAQKRVEEIEWEASKLKSEMAGLRRTVTALGAMCSEDPYFDPIGITEACTELMEVEQAEVSTQAVVADLERMGFDVASQKNVAASVHTVLGRMAKAGKIEKIENSDGGGGDKKLISWRGPKYDPDYIPF